MHYDHSRDTLGARRTVAMFFHCRSFASGLSGHHRDWDTKHISWKSCHFQGLFPKILLSAVVYVRVFFPGCGAQFEVDLSLRARHRFIAHMLSCTNTVPPRSRGARGIVVNLCVAQLSGRGLKAFLFSHMRL